MGFPFAASNGQSLPKSTHKSVKMATIVDSGASNYYVDDKLFSGISQLMVGYEEFDTPRIITTAGLHTLLGTATGKLRGKVIDSNFRTRMATLPVTTVLGVGRNLFSPGTAQSKGITTITPDNARLEEDNINFPLRRDGQLFAWDLELLPKQTCTLATSSDLIAANDADTWHRRLGHLNESSTKKLRDQPDLSFFSTGTSHLARPVL